MYAGDQDGRPAGFHSLTLENNACGLNSLCVRPRLSPIREPGAAMLRHAFAQSKATGCRMMHIGTAEENRILRRWYETAGFIHTGTNKYDFFPFTCGYTEKVQ